jgi:hypothetical protein
MPLAVLAPIADRDSRSHTFAREQPNALNNTLDHWPIGRPVPHLSAPANIGHAVTPHASALKNPRIYNSVGDAASMRHWLLNQMRLAAG